VYYTLIINKVLHPLVLFSRIVVEFRLSYVTSFCKQNMSQVYINCSLNDFALRY
jgi:hypothetical protein